MASLGPVPRKLNTVISSHSKFPHFSPSKPSNCSLPSTPLCSYAVSDSKNPTTNSNKNRQNALFDATTLNVNLIELCEEGKLAEALELMGQGSVADYGVFLAMLNLCEGTRSLEYGKRVHEFLRISREKHEFLVKGGGCGGAEVMVMEVMEVMVMVKKMKMMMVNGWLRLGEGLGVPRRFGKARTKLRSKAGHFCHTDSISHEYKISFELS
ncbi:uncharacterized protein LOC130969216 [Arachis stenosperma]|uniref:uncharacterized protein LOC130969216 n=1 Tax=Arachis stenosperma TaxID=217475 RepID=UPI0025AB9E0D|nr:uncharacterized protein LOC130969216 [Arachis stenosperma]